MNRPYILGFYSLTQELNGVYGWRGSKSKERFIANLQQMFPASVDKKVDDLKALTEQYHKYKKEYAKHLWFNPEEEHLSKLREAPKRKKK